MNLSHVQPDGVMTFWTAGISVRDALLVQLDALGLSQFMPGVRSNTDCLKSAMRDYCELESLEAKKDKRDARPDKLVQSLKKPKQNGFQVLDVDRHEDDNDYNKSFGCRVENDAVVITRGYANQESIQQFFADHKRLVTGGAVSNALAQIAQEHLGGVQLKSGLYWIAEEHRDLWSKVASAFASVVLDEDMPTVVTELRYLMDEGGVKAVRDAIVREVRIATTAMQEEIAKGDLGKHALTTRQIQAAALHFRVSKYEAILGEALAALHETVRVAEESAASAIAVQESEDVYVGVFG